MNTAPYEQSDTVLDTKRIPCLTSPDMVLPSTKATKSGGGKKWQVIEIARASVVNPPKLQKHWFMSNRVHQTVPLAHRLQGYNDTNIYKTATFVNIKKVLYQTDFIFA